MKNQRTSRMLLLLMAVCCCFVLLSGCNEESDGGEAEDETVVMPNFETNQLTTFSYTSLWYMSTIFDVEGGIEFKDDQMMRIVALFDDVSFEPFAGDQKQLEALYLELMDAQYIILEGGGTLMIGENGRILLTRVGGEVYLSAVGSFDAQSLRTLIDKIKPDSAV